jgi:C4-dicarboxylate-specific signal transduction histidine kinase
MMRDWRVWRLRTHFAGLLLVSMALTLMAVGVAFVVWRTPEIERESRLTLNGEIADISALLELLLGAQQTRLELVAGILDGRPRNQSTTVLEEAIDGGHLFQAMYVLSPQGQVQAAGLPANQRAQADDLVGIDLSGNALYRSALAGRKSVWSGRYLSALSGAVTVGLAHRGEDGRVLIGELPLPVLLRTLQTAAGQSASSIWVVDRSGEILADTEGGRRVGTLNILNWPAMQAALQDRPVSMSFSFERKHVQVVAMHVQTLDWVLVASAPAGWDHPEARGLLWFVGGSFLGCLAVGLLIAPFWARRTSQPLQDIVSRAALTTAGRAEGRPWPRGTVAEFNSLAANLENMATVLQEREQKSHAIFNASPVPMAVADADNGYRTLDVNKAWCLQLARPREEVLGRSGVEIGMWTAEQRQVLFDQVQGGRATAEAVLLRGDGQSMQAQVFARRLSLPTQQLTIWAVVDIGPMRRIEQALRELNAELEARVEHRTQALAASNAELSSTAAQLRSAQNDLVQAEKLASLGSLVAGVAHELNTPLGNGVMAVSAMADALRDFKASSQNGLKRSALQQLVASVAQGTDIAERNLRRAAELVQSFKQVAVDQTSAQRRSFELGEVVHEMVVSLRPSFSRTPYRIDVAVADTGLRMDSYPGALGQAIGNLIQNAVLHGFDGRDHGTVRIEGERAPDGRIVLRVADDGKGIAPEHLGRIFDPFMTTRMGRGGSGLGLHISYNAVVGLLGGALTVRSVQGQGAVFEMRLPDQAPHGAGAGNARGQAREPA